MVGVIEALVLVGLVDGSGNYEGSGKGCGGGPNASPAMQIKYRQRWAASFLDWFNWASQLKVKVLSSNLVGLSELSLHFHSPLALARLSDGGPAVVGGSSTGSSSTQSGSSSSSSSSSSKSSRSSSSSSSSSSSHRRSSTSTSSSSSSSSSSGGSSSSRR